MGKNTKFDLALHRTSPCSPRRVVIESIDNYCAGFSDEVGGETLSKW